MAEAPVSEFSVSPRIMEIGHQVYPLANISRVQSVKLVWAGKLGTFHPLKGIVVSSLIIGALVAAVTFGLPRFRLGRVVRNVAEQAVTVISVVLGIWIAYLLLVFLYRLLLRRTQYALVIEAAGTQYTALYGPDPREIQRIKKLIVDAIERPPPRTVTHPTFNVHTGDVISGGVQYKQTGAGTMTVRT